MARYVQKVTSPPATPKPRIEKTYDVNVRFTRLKRNEANAAFGAIGEQKFETHEIKPIAPNIEQVPQKFRQAFNQGATKYFKFTGTFKNPTASTESPYHIKQDLKKAFKASIG